MGNLHYFGGQVAQIAQRFMSIASFIVAFVTLNSYISQMALGSIRAFCTLPPKKLFM